jgi:hypothetical protein
MHDANLLFSKNAVHVSTFSTLVGETVGIFGVNVDVVHIVTYRTELHQSSGGLGSAVKPLLFVSGRKKIG